MKPLKSMIALLLLAITIPSFSQKKDLYSDGNGNVQIIKDYRIDLMMERINKTDETKGFRIQIHSGQRKEGARKAKSQFLMLFSEMGCYEIYQQPYFIVKVGNFLTKLEAQHFLNKLRENFPNSFIIPDSIDPLQLKGRQ